jgi:membrane associated rhomboid family serine protease
MNKDPAGDGTDEIVAEERPREPVFNVPMIVVLLIGACTAMYLIEAYALTDEQYFGLLIRAAFVPIRYSGKFDLDIYAFTTPFTYSFLHGSLPHLAINMIWLAAFGTPLANRLGNLRFLLFWAATAAAAAALHYVLHPLDQAPQIGASGAISGMMGAAARLGFRINRAAGRPSFDGPLLPIAAVFGSRPVVAFLTVWMAINLVTGLVGLAPGIDDRIAWEAHVGGFAAGFFGIGYFLGRTLRFPQGPTPD